MKNVKVYNFNDNFIDNLSRFIIENFSNKNNDFSRLMCVFGGKRPALFLRRSLAHRMKKAFFPPLILSVDNFIENVVSENRPVKRISDLDACYLIYSILKKINPSMLKGRKSFSEFLPWAKEIMLFIEQLDLEDIGNNSLDEIQKSASIGYDIPESINILLQNIISIRRRYHHILEKKELLTRGLLYSHAAGIIHNHEFTGLDKIIFCNLFYINSTQIKIMKTVYEKEKGIFIFGGDKNKWPILKNNEKNLGISIDNVKPPADVPEISIYSGYDMHTQVGIANDIIKSIDDIDDTVIVLPRSETLIPLLSEITHTVKKFNVSLGYPLKRTPVFTLFNTVINVQKSKKENLYYSFDYLKVLRHPLVKNLNLGVNSSITRVLVHKIEEVLKGKIDTKLGGSLFINLKEIEDLDELYVLMRDTLRSMDIKEDINRLKNILKELHDIFFYSFEEIDSFDKLSSKIRNVSSLVVKESALNSFPLNRAAMDSVFSLTDEISSLSFSHDKFASEEIFSIFIKRLEDGLISFSGSPLNGLQVLGLFEARSLNFKNVIFIDVNEGILPKLKVYEPLVPREIMLNLGINRLEKEEEIQKYQFMEIIASSKQTFLIYEENKDKERSRFLEELIWQKQKELKKLDVFSIPKGSFKVKIMPRDGAVKKTEEMVEYLKKRRLSATMLNSYIRCPLQFYYHYVLGLGENINLLDDLGADEIGTFLHELLEKAFKPFENKKPVIDGKFEKSFMRLFEDMFSSKILRRMKSDAFILKEIIKTRIKRFLDEERKRPVDKIICLEKEFPDTISFNSINYDFIAKVDRIDREDGRLIIIDYKSGSSDVTPKKKNSDSGMELNRESIREQIKSFQLPLYYIIASRYFKNSDIEAQIYNLRTLERKSFSIDNDEGLKRYLGYIGYVLKEMTDYNVQFVSDREERKCRFCPFFYLCR